MMRKEKPPEEQLLTPLQFRLNLDSMIQIATEISSKLQIIFDLDELVEVATSLIYQALGYNQVTVHLLDSDRQKFMLKIQASANYPQGTQSCAPDNFASLSHRAVRRQAVISIGDFFEEAAGYQQSPNIRSEIHIPLKHESDILGVLSFGSEERNTFDNSNAVTVLKMLASHLSIAINRTYRQEQRLQPPAEEEVYSQVADMRNILPEIQALTGDIRGVFDRIVRGVVEGLGYTAAVLAVVNEKDRTLPVRAIAYNNFSNSQNWDVAEKILGVQIIGSSVSLDRDRGNLGVQACLSGQIKVTHNLYDLFHPVVEQDLCRRIQKNSQIKTGVSIPLKVSDQVVGNLFVGTERNEFSAADLDALHFYVTNAAIAVQNSIHYEQVSQELALRKAELEQLRQIGRMISSTLDLEEVLKYILNGALELTNAKYGSVILLGNYASGLINRVVFPETMDVACVEQPGLRALLDDNPAPPLAAVNTLIRQANENFTGYGPNVFDSEADLQIKSLLGASISLDNKLIGVLSIASQKTDAFDESSLDLLEQIAVQAAIAINNGYQFKTEQEIRERLANISQVVAMGDLASNMVHSINNWVGSVRADLKYLMRQQQGGGLEQIELTELLEEMLINAEATLAMADNIKKPFLPFKQESIDVNECILEVLQKRQAEMDHIIVVEDLLQVPAVVATRQLELVFDNLLNNAVQAMKEQSRAILKFSSRLSRDGQWVEVTVQDTGNGLPEHFNVSDLFKLGVSSKANGLGYGLWWCDTFLKRWGGQIFCETNIKQGCKFLVKLPISTEDNLEQ